MLKTEPATRRRGRHLVTMSTPEQRMRMAKQIVDFEARRDKKGHLQVYKLPAWDGGGRYELSRTALSEPALVQCLPLPSKILQSFSMTFAPHASATRVVGRDERSKPWKGLVNRWYNALKFARTLLPPSQHLRRRARSRLWPRMQPFRRRASVSYSFFWSRLRAELRARQHDHAVEPLLRLGIRYQRGVERKRPSPGASRRERLGARARSHRPQMGLLVGRVFQFGIHFEVAVLK